MKNILLQKRKKKHGVVAVLCVALLAFVSCAFTQTTQKEQSSIEKRESIVTSSVRATNNGEPAPQDDMADFEMTLSGNVLFASYRGVFTYVGWFWQLHFCEGVEADYFGVMSGKNHKVKELTMTSTDFTYDLSTLVQSGEMVEGVQYSVVLYGGGNDGSVWQGSNVISYMYRTPVPLPPAPVKEGHTFTGWYYGTESEHGSACRAYDNAPIYENTTLHAHFTINTYRVTFDSNGGSDVAAQTVNWNTKATLAPPEKIGYTFKGWFLSDGTEYTNQPIKADTTLTAQWQAITYTVTFYVDNAVYKTLTVKYGTTLENAAAQADMTYYNLYSESGAALSKASVIGEDMRINAVKMSTKEKAGAFFKKTWWMFVLGLVGAALLVTAIVYTVKRGPSYGK